MWESPEFNPNKVGGPPQMPNSRSAARSSGTPSVIGADLSITGNLESTGEVQIDGEVQGDVHAGRIVVGEQAMITGALIADEIVIRGNVQGSIRGNNVIFQAGKPGRGRRIPQDADDRAGRLLRRQVAPVERSYVRAAESPTAWRRPTEAIGRSSLKPQPVLGDLVEHQPRCDRQVEGIEAAGHRNFDKARARWRSVPPTGPAPRCPSAGASGAR